PCRPTPTESLVPGTIKPASSRVSRPTMDSGSLAKSNAVVVRSPRMPIVETARTSTITHAETVRHGCLALARASAEVERYRDMWKLPPGSRERHAAAVRGYGAGKNERGPGSRNR